MLKPKNSNRMLFMLSLVGVCVSAYLLQSYMRHSELLCLNQGCEIVRNSVYSSIYGVPVPLYGLIGMAVILIITILQTVQFKKERIYVLAIVSTLGFISVGWLTYAELFLIHALCMWCVIEAVLMTVIFVISISLSKNIAQ
jgi:uncharacterized membrane protein